MTIKEFFAIPFWQNEYWGNALKDYGMALAIFVALFIIFAVFQKVVLLRLKKIAEQTKSDIDDELIKIVQTIKPPFYSFLAFYIALNFLLLNDFLNKFIKAVLIIWFVYQIIAAIQVLIDYVVRKKFSEEDRQSRTAIGVISTVLKIILWSLALLLILSNLGVNITSLIAGLGIGGIAVAMALKNILSDLFSSFAIYFDKPFMVGDFIVAGETSGTVEKIGIKTTRIRASQGEQIIVPNEKLISARVQNFKRLQERRASFQIGVVYDTPVEKLKKIPDMIKQLVEQVDSARFDRVHFTKFGDSALLFDIVYYVESDEYKRYLDINQSVNLKIKQAFEKERIVMAYPTQTIYLQKEPEP
jgi:small-conductance mechanosensitive channel